MLTACNQKVKLDLPIPAFLTRVRLHLRYVALCPIKGKRRNIPSLRECSSVTSFQLGSAARGRSQGGNRDADFEVTLPENTTSRKVFDSRDDRGELAYSPGFA